jgi:hypothetical protein
MPSLYGMKTRSACVGMGIGHATSIFSPADPKYRVAEIDPVDDAEPG